jgi:hypothetical protein
MTLLRPPGLHHDGTVGGPRHRAAQTEVGLASELAAIIRVLPYAVPRDQAEKPQGIRRTKPSSMTPSALTNGKPWWTLDQPVRCDVRAAIWAATSCLMK